MNNLEMALAGMDSKQRCGLILRLLESQSKEMRPANFKGFVAGAVLANLLGQMPDEYFQQFCEVLPCNESGCNCVKVSQAATDFFKFLREDFANEIARRKSVSRN